jgi:hypothetical protein
MTPDLIPPGPDPFEVPEPEPERCPTCGGPIPPPEP